MAEKKQITYREFLRREYIVSHSPYRVEADFYDTIRMGKTARVREHCKEPFVAKEGFGTLSLDALRNLRYHFIVTTAMVARVCIEGGMSLSESYSMSDYYIRKADTLHTLSEISDLHREMCIAYAERMRKIRKNTVTSRAVSLCIEYIYENLHTRITLDTLSEVTALSPAYLSRLFKKETGHTLSEYILSKKLETAQSMLVFSDYSIAEISASLAFPNQSYFSNLFKKTYGVSPLRYREENHTSTLV